MSIIMLARGVRAWHTHVIGTLKSIMCVSPLGTHQLLDLARQCATCNFVAAKRCTCTKTDVDGPQLISW